MALFKIIAMDPINGGNRIFHYDNLSSQVFDAEMVPIIFGTPQKFCAVTPVSKEQPGRKHGEIKRLKIQLGLSCNYACAYCNQRHMPHAEESTSPQRIHQFLNTLSTWFDGGSDGAGEGVKIEFWGGEPLVYWKTLKPLAESLHTRYPRAAFTLITNGSLLTAEKIEWLDRLDFNVGLSHDGPGHHVRGADPLDDPVQKSLILDLWGRLGPKNRMSFNAMLNRHNQSRAAIARFLEDRLGFVPPIGEGAFIDPYDQDGRAACLNTKREHIAYRNQALIEIRDGVLKHFTTIAFKVDDFISAIVHQRPASAVGQKCGMDRPDNIAVDLSGNVLTCQNTSAVGVGMNGESHRIGHVCDLDAVEMKTASHWSFRDACANCPVLQLCKGSCMMLHGELWEVGCDAAFSDNVPIFSAAFEAMTGYLPFYIEGPQRADRHDLYGLVHGVPEEVVKKPFPVAVVAA